MEQFRLLNRTRQSTEYSCGASALRSVLSYWGTEVDESELMKIVGTTSEFGTFPGDIVRGAHALGFQAEAREGLTLDEVAAFTANGDPVIALGQMWRSRAHSNPNVVEDWHNGHYVVVLGLDKKYVYFQDPYVRMGKGFVPRKTFEEHWHQIMGGAGPKRSRDLKGRILTNPKLMHLGIFIRGKHRARSRPKPAMTMSRLSHDVMGSLNLLVSRFRGVLLPYDFLSELSDIWKESNIRADAFVFLRKDQEGNVSGLQGSSLQDEAEAMAINALVAAIASRSVPRDARSKADAALKAAAAGDFGLPAQDLLRIAQKLPPCHSAIAVLFENLWERRFKEVAGRYDGWVSEQMLMPPQALAKAADVAAARAGT
jgi:predicted double-glycine peptidase